MALCRTCHKVIPCHCHHARALTGGTEKDAMIPAPNLSTKELDVLIRFANGEERATIAAAYKVTHATVKNWTDNICAKLGAENFSNAIAIAFCWGVLAPQHIDGFKTREYAS